MSEHTGWKVRKWTELERMDGGIGGPGKRLFALEVVGVDLPVEGEHLVPAATRGEEESAAAKISDFCRCGHTLGSHGVPADGSEYRPCVIEGCSCGNYRLLAAGVEGVEEMPPDPHSEPLNPDTVIESAAIQFMRELEREAGLHTADPETWMALQRLIDKGWRFLPPPERS